MRLKHSGLSNDMTILEFFVAILCKQLPRTFKIIIIDLLASVLLTIDKKSPIRKFTIQKKFVWLEKVVKSIFQMLRTVSKSDI